jgi:hypothetical protein
MVRNIGHQQWVFNSVHHSALLAFVVNPNILEDGCPALLALSFFSDLIKLSCVDFTGEEKEKKYT